MKQKAITKMREGSDEKIEEVEQLCSAEKKEKGYKWC